ncbi:MAG: DUF3667 domain-containing protein [Phaeodactylibacter sp.]|uniref:DUF3667 domain-containing protein n=1 Tax=Phaeodactylibacter sp. TaxID=1940289 RepID=UPI0032EF7370
MTMTQTAKCKRCNHELSGEFCSACGHPSKLKRIDGRYLLSEMSSVLNFDKGILYTIRELFLRPGDSIRRYIKEDRSRLVKPVIFLIVCSLAYTIGQQFLNFEKDYAQANVQVSGESAVRDILVWMQKNYGYANIIMAFFIAFWVQVLFRRRGYNYFEVLILLFYVIGLGMLIMAVFGVVESLVGFGMLSIGGLIAYAYAGWAIARFYDKRKKINYLKGFLAYTIGTVTAFAAAILIGMLIDAMT